jgi:hypothetical protein
VADTDSSTSDAQIGAASGPAQNDEERRWPTVNGAPGAGRGASGEMSNMDDVAGFGPEGAGGLHGTPPGWFGTPLARAEKRAEQGGNPPASEPVPDQAGRDEAEQNDWRVSAGEAEAVDQQSATGTEPPGTFGQLPGQSGDLGPGLAEPD